MIEEEGEERGIVHAGFAKAKREEGLSRERRRRHHRSSLFRALTFWLPANTISSPFVFFRRFPRFIILPPIARRIFGSQLSFPQTPIPLSFEGMPSLPCQIEEGRSSPILLLPFFVRSLRGCV